MVGWGGHQNPKLGGLVLEDGYVSSELNYAGAPLSLVEEGPKWVTHELTVVLVSQLLSDTSPQHHTHPNTREICQAVGIPYLVMGREIASNWVPSLDRERKE